MIRLLIVDDSETEIQILKHMLAHDRDIQIVGIAHNGKQAVEQNALLRPDLITMDIQMPVMSGIEAIHAIMAQYPVPIVVISSRLNDELDVAFKAMEAGALSVLEKPVNILAANFDQVCRRMIDTIRAMAEIKVVKRRRFHSANKKAVAEIMHHEEVVVTGEYDLVGIGTSVGGPQALKKILLGLPKNFPLPIVIVQHMVPGFINGFTHWLDNNVPMRVKEAEDMEVLQNGVVYFAPDHFHLEIKRNNGVLIAKLINLPPVSGFKPSATVLLNSIAAVCKRRAVGVLLTGMGNDGADGLLALKKAGGHTLIQDRDSAVVFGMAGIAQSIGAVDKVIEIDKIAEYLNGIVKQ